MTTDEPSPAQGSAKQGDRRDAEHADAARAGGGPQADAAEDAPTRTRLSRGWLLRVVGIFLGFGLFGLYGLYDGLIAYPARGAAYAEYKKLEYLRAAEQADREDPGVLRRTVEPGSSQSGVGIADPAAELERLETAEILRRNTEDAADEQSARHRRAVMELARQAWLVAISRIEELDQIGPQEFGGRAEVRQLVQELESEWATRNQPSPLAAYDIPSQWAIFAVCCGIALYCAVLFVRVASRSYSWDPATKTLTLPGGRRLSPGDLEDVDKRKWDKFIVLLVLKDGETVRFDTFRYAHLEDWLLEMEAEAFPERAAELAAEKERAERAAEDTGERAGGEAGAASSDAGSAQRSGAESEPEPSAEPQRDGG